MRIIGKGMARSMLFFLLLIFALSMCYFFHLLLEVVIVLSNSYCVGMLGTQHAFADSEGSLVERLGLLILALVPVEDCQVIDGT